MHLSVFILPLLAIIKSIHPILVFDCATEQTNVTIYALNEIKTCIPSISNKSFNQTNIQVVKKNRYIKIDYTSCKVIVKSLLFHCGQGSHSSILDDLTDVHVLSEEECKDLVGGRRFKFENRDLGIQNVGKKNVHRVNLHGRRNQQNGYCEGEDFYYGGHMRRNAHSVDTIEVTLITGIATWDTHTDTIAFGTSMMCKRETRKCMDDEGARVFFDFKTYSECNNEGLNVLYTGKATITKDPSGKSTALIQREKRAFALNMLELRSECGLEMYYTGNEGYFVVDYGDSTPPLPISYAKNKEENLNLMVDSLTRIILLERRMEQSLTELVSELDYKICENRRLDYYNLLSLARINQEEFSYNLMKGPGYHAEIRGELVYILDCKPMRVPIQPINGSCYQEIPISVNNKTMFARPKSRVVTQLGTEIDCDPVLPVGYKIGDGWYNVFPSRSRMPEPQVFDPNEPLKWSYKPIISSEANGLYTKDEIEQLRYKILFDQRREAATTIITRHMGGQAVDYQGLSLFAHTPDVEIENLLTKLKGSVIKTFDLIGRLTSGILGIYFIIKIIKASYEWITNFRMLGAYNAYDNQWDRFKKSRSSASATRRIIKRTVPKPSSPTILAIEELPMEETNIKTIEQEGEPSANNTQQDDANIRIYPFLFKSPETD